MENVLVLCGIKLGYVCFYIILLLFVFFGSGLVIYLGLMLVLGFGFWICFCKVEFGGFVVVFFLFG